MTSKIDVVIDIETLGTDVDAKIIGIGAVAVVDNVLPDRYPYTGGKFELHTDRLFHTVINEGLAGNMSRSFTEGTLQFWQEQPEKLQQLYRYSNVARELGHALLALGGFISNLEAAHEKCVIRPWGNGSVFDISVLEHAFLQCNTKVPWDFWNIRDVRTRIEDAQLDKKSIPFEGTKHYALDDAYHEAKLIVAAQDILTDAINLREGITYQ